ncbi:MAG: MFS transporter [Promethearchaeota archaeon]
MSSYKKKVSESIQEAVIKALDQLDILEYLSGFKTFLLKPNYIATESPDLGNITCPETIEGIVQFLTRRAGKSVDDLILGEGSYPSTTEENLTISGARDLTAKYGMRLLNLNEDEIVEVEIPGALALHSVELARTALDVDCVVSIPSLKTHSMATTTLALKNLMGTLSHKSIIHSRLHEKIADLAHVVRPSGPDGLDHRRGRPRGRRHRGQRGHRVYAPRVPVPEVRRAEGPGVRRLGCYRGGGGTGGTDGPEVQEVSNGEGCESRKAKNHQEDPILMRKHAGGLFAVFFLAISRTIIDIFSSNGVVLFTRLHGGSDFTTSLVGSAAAGVYMFAPVLMGRLSDRIGRRRAVLASLGVNVASQVVYLASWHAIGVLSFETVVLLLVLGRMNDGLCLALFWPVLQSRLSDEQTLSGGADHEKHVHQYNLSWNTGIVIGFAFFILATLADSVAALLENLFLLVVAGMALFCLSLAVALVYFWNLPADEGGGGGDAGAEPAGEQPRPPVKGVPAQDALRDLLREERVTFVGLILWSFALGVVYLTITNHFTAVGVVDGAFGSLNLIPFIPLALLIRVVAQTVGSSTVHLPEVPKEEYAANHGSFAAAIAAIGVVVWILPGIGVAGLVSILVLLGVLGFVGGRIYSLCFSTIVKAGGRGDSERNAGTYMGAFEATIGVGFTIGPLVSGALTEALPYHVPYLIAALLVGVFALYAGIRGRGSAPRPTDPPLTRLGTPP